MFKITIIGVQIRAIWKDQWTPKLQTIKCFRSIKCLRARDNKVPPPVDQQCNHYHFLMCQPTNLVYLEIHLNKERLQSKWTLLKRYPKHSMRNRSIIIRNLVYLRSKLLETVALQAWHFTKSKRRPIPKKNKSLLRNRAIQVQTFLRQNPRLRRESTSPWTTTSRITTSTTTLTSTSTTTTLTWITRLEKKQILQQIPNPITRCTRPYILRLFRWVLSRKR